MGLVTFLLDRVIDGFNAIEKLLPPDEEYEAERRNTNTNAFAPDKHDVAYMQFNIRDMCSYRMGMIGFYKDKIIYHLNDDPTAAILYLTDITGIDFKGDDTTISTGNIKYKFCSSVPGFGSFEPVFKKYYYISHCWNCHSFILGGLDLYGEDRCEKCGRFICKKCGKCHCGFEKW